MTNDIMAKHAMRARAILKKTND